MFLYSFLSILYLPFDTNVYAASRYNTIQPFLFHSLNVMKNLVLKKKHCSFYGVGKYCGIENVNGDGDTMLQVWKCDLVGHWVVSVRLLLICIVKTPFVLALNIITSQCTVYYSLSQNTPPPQINKFQK